MKKYSCFSLKRKSCLLVFKTPGLKLPQSKWLGIYYTFYSKIIMMNNSQIVLMWNCKLTCTWTVHCSFSSPQCSSKAEYWLMGHKYPLQLIPIVNNLSIAFFFFVFSACSETASKTIWGSCKHAQVVPEQRNTVCKFSRHRHLRNSLGDLLLFASPIVSKRENKFIQMQRGSFQKEHKILQSLRFLLISKMPCIAWGSTKAM